MGLIVFIFFFFSVLTILTLNIITKKEAVSKSLLKVSISATATTLFFLTTMLVLYYSIPNWNVYLSTLFLAGISVTSFFLLDMAVRMPSFEKRTGIKFFIFNCLIHLTALIILLLFFEGLFWDVLSGFKFSSQIIFGMSAERFYASIVLLFTSVLALIISVVKAAKEQSKIYKQQMLFFAMSITVSLIIYGVVFYLANIFTWVVAILPAGYVMLIFLANYAFSVSIVYDKKQLAFAFTRFLSFILVFALLAGYAASLILTKVRNIYVQMFLLIVSAFIFLVFRNIVSQKLRWFLGDTSEYAKAIEEKLQKINYEAGREEVLNAFTNIMIEHLKASGMDVLITSEQDILEPVYSTFGTTSVFPIQSPVFESLLKKHSSVIMRSEVLTSAEFAPIRNELISIMNKTSSEVLIFVREGQKLIGIIGIAERRKKEEYTDYDYGVLTNLYSYFFLVVYYLRNIAKEDIILTVDREIEMSDQIIGSIQKNMDKVEKKVVEVDSVSYSAHQLGGDFIDFIKLSEDRYFFLIGDVAGKGLSASMSMIILKSALHTYLSEIPDFKELVIKLNSFIKGNLPKGSFFAGLFGIIDFKTSTIYYLNCGIPLMSMYIDSYKNVIEIQGEGRVLGFVKNIKPFLKVRKITMNRNDTIVFTTDGLLESANLKGERFGNERVGRILATNKEKSAKEIANTIYNRLLDFIAREIEDDVTILVFKHV
ncbi:PP2C family protein-serine/threonine phosphatase [Treponema pedis]|uniref:PP2C family protein-serine/threonine phosphatase n=1 Tax=Treponema pedis TaxID=409322 RepID=UPI0004034146|nr:SpoIIE family protein phosphatase [Treponema pedis]QSI04067.1 siderophore-interacting protein [Treponema pedis]